MTASLGAVVGVFALLIYTVSHCVFFWYFSSCDVERATRRRAVGLLCLVRSVFVAEGRTDAVQWLDGHVVRCATEARRSIPDDAAEEREAHNLRRVGV